MTYDQWKTRSPDDDAPVCDFCGGWLHRGVCFDLYCPDCEDEIESYRWEPESGADERDGAVAERSAARSEPPPLTSGEIADVISWLEAGSAWDRRARHALQLIKQSGGSAPPSPAGWLPISTAPKTGSGAVAPPFDKGQAALSASGDCGRCPDDQNCPPGGCMYDVLRGMGCATGGGCSSPGVCSTSGICSTRLYRRRNRLEV